MSQNAAQLLIKLGLDQKELRKLNKGIDSARNRAKKFGNEVKMKTAKAVSVGVKAMAASFAALSASVVLSTKNIDELAKTARKLGTTVSQLQELQYAAKLGGVSVETMNMAMQRMVRRVSEAAQGTGEAVNALKELNLDALVLARNNPAKQFQMIQEQMNKVANQGDRVRLAMKLFDSEGVALVNVFGVNMQKVNKELREMGVLLSDAETKKVEALNDSFTAIKTIVGGISNQIAVLVSGPLKDAINRTKDWLKGVGGAREVARTIVVGLIKAIKVAGTFTSFALKGIEMMNKGFMMLSSTLNSVWDTGKSAAGFFFSYTRQGLSDMFTRIKELNNITPWGTRAGDSAYAKGLEQQRSLTSTRGGNAFDVASQENMEKQRQAFASRRKSINDIKSMSNELDKSQEKIDKKFSKFITTMDSAETAVTKQVATEKKKAEASSRATKQIQSMGEAAQQANRAITGSSSMSSKGTGGTVSPFKQLSAVSDKFKIGGGGGLSGGARPSMPSGIGGSIGTFSTIGAGNKGEMLDKYKNGNNSFSNLKGSSKERIEVIISTNDEALSAKVLASESFAAEVVNVSNSLMEDTARKVNR